LKEGHLVIGMSLWRDDINFIYGALRNIQLANIFFPEWNVRVLIPKNIPNGEQLQINENMIQKMKFLGAAIIYVDMKSIKVPLSWISSLILDDNNIKYCMIRDVRHRLNECDAVEINDFIHSNKTIQIPNYLDKKNNMTIVQGSWEANIQQLKELLGGKTMQQFIQVYFFPT